MRKLLFVINPISGGIDKPTIKSHIKSCCSDQSNQVFFHKTSGSNDSESLHKAIEMNKPDTVIACGGDGTVNLVAIAVLGTSLKMGIIPMGSANGMATELNIPEDIDEATAIILKDKVLSMDVLCINDKHHCLHLSDIGFNAKLIQRFEQGNYRGKLSYARHFFETLFNKKAYKYTFIINGKIFKRRADMVVFANARMYGTGAVVNPNGKLDDRKFEVCIFKPYPWYAIFRLTFLFFTGRLNYSPFVKIVSTDEVLITSKKSEHLQIDGELIDKYNQVHVKLSDNQLSVLVP